MDLPEPSPTTTAAPNKGVTGYSWLRPGRRPCRTSLVGISNTEVDIVADGAILERPVTEWS
ncbi:MAG: hypothetical protein AVDCRST_MAG59-1672 [uncultured Thermomicrobiales bacterium]|uniref:Uncharacterized protein n=1 Tax=uncultured Thermomicrobiales bacterium TaxID=1645740 RepID=A0A6J4UKR7_9BACT|nr:MAG: hypothetical protein AVDCRST_MAG59-1672 [uncultured Thermomicrobiales bacterium]